MAPLIMPSTISAMRPPQGIILAVGFFLLSIILAALCMGRPITPMTSADQRLMVEEPVLRQGLMEEPTSTPHGEATTTCLQVHYRDLKHKPSNRPVLNTNPTSLTTTHQRMHKFPVSRNKDKPHATSHYTETQFCKVDNSPNGQMDERGKEEQEGTLAVSSASLSCHPHLVFTPTGPRLSGCSFRRRILLVCSHYNAIFNLWILNFPYKNSSKLICSFIQLKDFFF